MKLPRWFAKTALILALVSLSGLAYSQVAISINIAPPELPVYDQPPCPAPNLIWTPGYWSWGDDGYYWVPGAWVEAPAEGLLWTPGYWDYDNGNYMWNDGYWAPEVGFYGGVDYGYGYPGEGFYGGRWMGNTFSYNVAVWSINNNAIHHTYRNEVNYHNQYGRVSFNGGHGVQARPTPAQRTVREHKRSGPIQAQQRQATLARSLRQNYAKVNNGHPEHAAMERPAKSAADFSHAVPARAAQPNNRNNNRPGPNRNNEPNRNGNRNNRPAVNNTRPEAKPESRPNNRPEARPESRPNNNRPEATPESRPAPQPGARPTPRSNERPAVQPNRETRPESRPEARPQPRPEQHPEARPQAQHEQHPEARPQAQHEQHPEARPQAQHEQHPEARPQAQQHEQHPEARPQARQEAHPDHPDHPAKPEHEKKQPQ